MAYGQTVLGSYPYAFLAHVARTRLEEEGIPAAVWDDYTASTFSFYEAHAIGGVRLVVPTSEAERARQILAAPLHVEPVEDEDAEFFDESLPQFALEEEPPPEEEPPVCPNCGAPQAVADKSRSRVGWWGVVALLLGPGVLFWLWSGVQALWGIAPEVGSSAELGLVLLGVAYAAFVLAVVAYFTTRRRPRRRCASCQHAWRQHGQ